MTIVVSDNSPLNVLVRVDCVEILPQIFDSVIVPGAVVDEMRHPAAPIEVRSFAESLPEWLTVAMPLHLLEFEKLGLGERAAISLATERDLPLLIDEAAGRRVATQLGLQVVGAIGVLERAADLSLIGSLAEVHDRVRGLDFRVSEEVLSKSLQRHLRRRGC